ncbi:hypothetical protein AK823_04255 [Psychrobacter sp. P2G3]|nr:hypothetical protein AK823_04255 [Psychrobacter sp. P2G3]
MRKNKLSQYEQNRLIKLFIAGSIASTAASKLILGKPLKSLAIKNISNRRDNHETKPNKAFKTKLLARVHCSSRSIAYIKWQASS